MNAMTSMLQWSDSEYSETVNFNVNHEQINLDSFHRDIVWNIVSFAAFADYKRLIFINQRWNKLISFHHEIFQSISNKLNKLKNKKNKFLLSTNYVSVPISKRFGMDRKHSMFLRITKSEQFISKKVRIRDRAKYQFLIFIVAENGLFLHHRNYLKMMKMRWMKT